MIKSIKIAYIGSVNSYTNNESRLRNTNRQHTYRNNREEEDDSDENDVYYAGKPKRSSSKSKYHAKNDKNQQISNENELFQWYSVSVPSVDPSFSVKARFLNSPTNLNNLVGFNNTGNICNI